MKKVLITMAVLTGMMAGGMVLSSFTAPKTNDKTVCSQINVNDEWREVGRYYGYDKDGNRSTYKFVIWEKSGMCGAYYWTYANQGWIYNPDNVNDDSWKSSGQLRQNTEKKWYASLDGTIYFIDF